MNKLVMTVVCGIAVTHLSVLAQATQDPQLQANASNAIVQQELNQPDGTAIALSPDGSFQIFARGTGTYDFNDAEDINDARREGALRAKANLVKFVKEKIASGEGIDMMSKKARSITADGKVEQAAASKESVKIATTSLGNAAEDIMTGIIILKEQKVPNGTGGEIQVTAGISSKTFLAAQKVAQAISQSLSNRGDTASGAISTQDASSNRPNVGETRTAVTDF